MNYSLIHKTFAIVALFLTATLYSIALKAQEPYPTVTQTQVPGTSTQNVVFPNNNIRPLYNYVRSMVPRTRVANEALVTETSAPEQVSISTVYTDGLGTPVQTVQRNASKTASGAYRHMVSPNDTRIQADAIGVKAFPSATATFNQYGVGSSLLYHNSSRYPSEAGILSSLISGSLVKNTSTSNERSVTAYAPGKSRIGQGRGTKTTIITNKVISGSNAPATNIRIWNVNAGGQPESPGIYFAGQLSGTLTQNADGLEKYVLSDKSGKPVYESVFQKITGIFPAVKVYAETYYVYDDLDRLRYTLSPKAVEAARQAGWVLSQQLIDELCFVYRYDAKGRQYAVHKPGEQGFTELVYSKEGQTIMRRSPLEKTKGLWELMFYDKAGRVIATALYANTQDRDYWQAQANAKTPQASNSPFYYIWAAGRWQYPPKTGLSNTEVMSYGYFDEYPTTVLAAQQYNASPMQPHLATSGDVPSLRASTYGFATASEVKVILNPGVVTYLQDWTAGKSFYDYYGRMIYSVSSNATGALDSVYMQYNVQGQVLNKLHLRNAIHPGTNNRRTTEAEAYGYEDYSGRLMGIWRSTNGAPGEPAVRYTYDEMGRMSKEVLGNDAETRFYTYNVRGELLGINEQYALTGDKGSSAMSFGEALRYDYGFAYPRYDGLIAGMVWRGAGGTAVKAHSYTYSYDYVGRMTSAQYYEATNTGGVPSSWTTQYRNYAETMGYDLNGNITSGTKWGVSQDPAYPGPKQVDRFTYHYQPNSNKLDKVVDVINYDYGTGDYQNGTAQGYAYDASGNLTEDKSKNISTVVYTWFNKPQTVSFSDGSSIHYTYDAGGTKLQEVVKVGTRHNYTNYISGGVYKGGILNYISTAQGRTNMVPATPRQEYFVKDHIGNIRSIVASSMTGGTVPVVTYSAGYEPDKELEEEALFEKVATLREDKPGSLNAADEKAGLLSTNERLGTSIMLKVMAGDKLNVNADNFYETLNSSSQANNAEAGAGALFEQMMGSLAGAAGALPAGEGGAAQSVLAERILSNPEAIGAYEDLLDAETDETRPKAFLNYLFFDDDMKLVQEHSRIWQADGEDSWSKIGTDENNTLEVPQNGYIVVYLSNQSTQEAWFDNIDIGLSSGMLLEETHYYPYGLPIVGLGSVAANSLKNRQHYQGNEYIEDRGLDWMDFHNRAYDPQLGRFLSIDPLADIGGQQVLSPYHAMACNPVSMVDPLGLMWHPASYLPNYGIPSASVANIEGQTVMLGGVVYRNFESDYNDYKSLMEVLRKEQTDREIAEVELLGVEAAQDAFAEFTGRKIVRGSSVQQNGEGGVNSGENIVTYRLPGLTDEQLNQVAAEVGRDRSNIRCNGYSLAFADAVLKLLHGTSGLDLSKLPQTGEDIEHMAVQENTPELLDNVGVGANNRQSLNNRNAKTIGLELEKGNIPYIIEYNGVNGHRIVVVSVTYNQTNYYKSSVTAYNPTTGKIENRPNFFDNGKGGQGYIYNYTYSFIIKHTISK